MAKNFMESIGNNIKKIRKQLGLTQEELAMHVGVTPQAVSRWENGTGMPDISLVVPLAKTLRVSTDSLFGINEEKSDIVYSRYVYSFRCYDISYIQLQSVS